MYYDSNKGEEQEESQALFPPLMHRRERKGDRETKKRRRKKQGKTRGVFLNAHTSDVEPSFFLFDRSVMV